MRYSIVIPVHNEAGSIAGLAESLVQVMQKTDAPYECIFVDDGSSDDSAELIKQAVKNHPACVGIVLDGRIGLSGALQSGFDYSKGDVVITIDGDGQNDPEDIPALLEKLSQGFDMVVGWRFNRNDPIPKRVSSHLANIVRKSIMRENIHDVGCKLRVFKRSVLNNVNLSGGLQRFFTLIVARLGFKIAEVKVNHRARTHGSSKFGNWDRLSESIRDLWLIKRVGLRTLMNRNKTIPIKEIIRHDPDK